MQLASPQPSSCLVLGDVRFLTGALPKPSKDIITLVPVSHTLTTEPRNTIVMGWRELGPTHLMARTIDGHHRTVIPCDAGDLFDMALPGPALNCVVTTVSNAAGNSTGTPLACVPLFYVTATPTTEAVELHVYSQIRFLADDACFIRITPTPLWADSIDDLSWLTTALELHARQAQYLNSHECHYRKLLLLATGVGVGFVWFGFAVMFCGCLGRGCGLVIGSHFVASGLMGHRAGA